MNSKVGIIVGTIIGVLLIVVFSSITTVPTGHAGIKTRFRTSTS